MNAKAAQRVAVTAADGLALQTRRIGPEVADTTVILLHGLLGDGESWRCQTTHLASRHPDIRLIAYDQRGHGRSGRGCAPSNTLGQLACDLDAVIDTTTPTGDIVLIGHSMGAMTILEYLQHHQSRNADRITGVGLIATAAGDFTRIGLGRLLATPLARRAWTLAAHIPGSVDAWRINAVRVTEPIWRLGTKRAPTVAALIGAPELAIVAGFLDSICHFDGTAAYRALSRTPTLIMCGTTDWVTPPHHSEAIAAAVSAAEFVDVPGAGHMLMLDRPDVVNDRLDALLKRARRELAPRPPTPAAQAVPATAPLPRAA
ncbi:MAG: alpha/beta hydrolase [Mycobacterium sp.]|nr:alpha/beta hydrolase [Mycobacterium sp.]MBV8293093.1 alpha/beta hydrolase [Mycobacterium sp.]